MKKTILIIILYISGCICAYNYTKFYLINNNYENKNQWTKRDRFFSLTASLTSWVGVAAIGILWVLRNHANDEHAEW